MFRNLISESQLRIYGRKKSKNAKIDSFPMQKKKHELKRCIYSIKRLQLEIITLFTLRHDVTVQFVHKGASWHFLYFQSFDCIWSRNKNLIRISYCSIALRVNGAFHKLWSEAPIVSHLKSEWNRWTTFEISENSLSCETVPQHSRRAYNASPYYEFGSHSK